MSADVVFKKRDRGKLLKCTWVSTSETDRGQRGFAEVKGFPSTEATLRFDWESRGDGKLRISVPGKRKVWKLKQRSGPEGHIGFNIPAKVVDQMRAAAEG